MVLWITEARSDRLFAVMGHTIPKTRGVKCSVKKQIVLHLTRKSTNSSRQKTIMKSLRTSRSFFNCLEHCLFCGGWEEKETNKEMLMNRLTAKCICKTQGPKLCFCMFFSEQRGSDYIMRHERAS